MNITTIVVGPAFASVLAKIHDQCFDQVWNERTIAETLATPGTVALIAQDDSQQALGFVVVRGAAPDAEILTIATWPKAQRQGIGKALLKDMEQRLRASGVQTLFLEVATDNPAAQGLYESLGFVIKGRRKSYYARSMGTQIDALVMSKTL